MKKKIVLVICIVVLLIMSMALVVACDNTDKAPVDDDGGITNDGGSSGNNGGGGNGNKDNNNNDEEILNERELVDLSQYLTYQVVGDDLSVKGLQEDKKNAVSGVIDSGSQYIDKAKIVIPDYYNGKKVIGVESEAFSGYIGLRSITIPDSVTSIGYGAFSGCSNLTKMVIPFVGEEIGKTSSDTYQYPFGYIFGEDSYTGGIATKQHYYGNNMSYVASDTYYIPSSLKSVTVTGGNILYGAFDNCDNITSIILSDNITSIGRYAFSGCSSLTKITIPKSVTSIESAAFAGCDNLTKINITDLSKWCAISFDSNDANPLYYVHNLYLNGKLVTNLEIPNSVTSIGDRAFYGCSSLTSITIPNSVTSIGYGAFSNCVGLTSITIPNSVTKIGGVAFYGCSSLTSIVVQDGNTKYHSNGNCLINTESKTLILGCSTSVIPTDGSVTSIGSYAFYNCSSLTIITIPNSVKSIGYGAFSNCVGLTSITIPNSVTSIENYAFSNCSSLTIITIPDSVETIGSSAFSGCGGLIEIAIPFVGASKDESGYRSFSYIFGGDPSDVPSKLKTVTITGGTSIGHAAFSSCSSLTSITIPDSVTSIGQYAFYNCSNLTAINIPNSVTSIELKAFANCRSLTSLTIGSGVRSIAENAFDNCSSLTNIVVQEGNTRYYSSGNCLISTYGATLLLGCSTSVIPTDGSVAMIGDSAFSKCSSLTSITIPDSVTWIGDYAFSECSGLTSVTIPDSVTSIDSYAFYGCSALTSIIFRGTKSEWHAIRKYSFWDEYTGSYTIYCTDGNISK